MKVNLPILFLIILVCVGVISCTSPATDLDATSTYVIANVLSTRTAEAITNPDTVTPGTALNTKSTVTQTPLGTQTRPTVLFFDDFSDPDSGWGASSEPVGVTGYFSGSYRIIVNSTDTYLHGGINRTFSDVVIEVDAKQIGGPEYNEFGVTCRVRNEDNFYLFVIGSDNYFGIAKKIKGEWVDIGSNTERFNDTVVRGKLNMNHLRVSCNYDQLKLEVNGSVLVEATDGDIRSGDVGMYVAAFDEKGVEVLFDNFMVTTP